LRARRNKPTRTKILSLGTRIESNRSPIVLDLVLVLEISPPTLRA
jgi:hypothetical protein